MSADDLLFAIVDGMAEANSLAASLGSAVALTYHPDFLWRALDIQHSQWETSPSYRNPEDAVAWLVKRLTEARAKEDALLDECDAIHAIDDAARRTL